MRVSLDDGPSHTLYLQCDAGPDLLIQSDGDITGMAAMLGWIRCPCARTDGSIDCEHRTVDDLIAKAQTILDEFTGQWIDDPRICERSGQAGLRHGVFDCATANIRV